MLKGIRNIKDILPKKWWNGTNDSPNPCIDWVDLLHRSVDEGIQNQIGSCQPSRQHVRLQQPCHTSWNISPSAHRLMKQLHNLTIKFHNISGWENILATLLANKAVPAKPTVDAQVTAWGIVMRSEGSGLSLVLFILASFLISNT